MGRLLTVEKQPYEVRLYTLNFSDDLASGETISSYELISATDLSNDSNAIATIINGSLVRGNISADKKTLTVAANGTTIGVPVKAGADGKIYNISIGVTTSAGNKYEGDIALHITDIKQ